MQRTRPLRVEEGKGVHMTENNPDKSNVVTSASKRHRLAPVSWAELEQIPEQPSLIKGVLDQNGTSLIFGESGTGKTFLALDIAFHIARGMSWNGRTTTQGAIVYVITEGAYNFRKRLEAIRQHNDIQDHPPLYVVMSSIDLRSGVSDAATLNREIKQLVEREELDGVSLIVIDTLARAMSGGDENTPVDMGKFIKHCDRIRTETGAHLMIIHHSGKDQSRGARGHSSLRAAVDTEIEITGGGDNVITAEITKQRDGETGGKFCFRLETIEISQDADGEAEKSCVLVPVDVPAASKPGLKGQKHRAMNILMDCIADRGETRPVKIGHDPVLCVTIEEYREALKLNNISVSDKPDSIDKAIRRAIEGLNNAGMTESYGDYIWIPDRPDNNGRTS
jgi:hypothetical protein